VAEQPLEHPEQLDVHPDRQSGPRRADAAGDGRAGYSAASTREFGMDAFYANYLADLPPGTALPDDAGNAQQPDMAGGQVTLAWTLYEQYGDRTTLAAQYPAMKAFVDTDNTQAPSHIWPDNRGFGDWCPPVHDGGVNGGQGGPNEGNCTSEVSLVNTALSYVQALDVAKSAQALGKTADAATYTTLADSIKQAFNAHFLNADGSSYGDGRQTTSVLRSRSTWCRPATSRRSETIWPKGFSPRTAVTSTPASSAPATWSTRWPGSTGSTWR